MKRKPASAVEDAEEKLKRIRALFFGPKGKTFGKSKSKIDYSLDMNLLGPLIDLEFGVNDKGVQKTLKWILKKLGQIREVLKESKEPQEPNGSNGPTNAP